MPDPKTTEPLDERLMDLAGRLRQSGPAESLAHEAANEIETVRRLLALYDVFLFAIGELDRFRSLLPADLAHAGFSNEAES